MGDNLKQKMIGALAWGSIDRIGQQAVQFVIGLVLARLLSPADYGLIGLITVFFALSLVISDGGFSQALLREKNDTQKHYSTVFYVNMLLAVILYTTLYFTTPLIASFFKQPQLTIIGRVSFLAIFFNAAYLVPYIKICREMDFKTLAKINITSITLSGTVGIILAVAGYNVWALVAQQSLYHVFRFFLYYWFVRWKPSLMFSFKILKQYFSYSINLLVSTVLTVIFNNLYIVIIGRFYPKNEVGYYSYAHKLSEGFNFTIHTILISSSNSLFAKIHDDAERVRRVYRSIVQKVSILIFPALLAVVAVAKPLIFVLVSDKWLPAVPYFQLICLAGLFVPFYNLNLIVLLNRGKSRLNLWIEILKKGMMLLSAFLCFPYGIVAMLWGYVASCCISYIISAIYLKKDVQHYLGHQLKDLISGLLIGIVIAAILYGLSFIISNLYILLVVQIVVGCLIYLFCVKFLQPELYRKGKSFIVEKLKRNSH